MKREKKLIYLEKNKEKGKEDNNNFNIIIFI